MRIITFILLINIVGVGQQSLVPDSLQDKKMQWFNDAKLGIFIHWGIYSVKGIDESWSFYNGYISHEDYMEQAKGFTAKNYNPKQWVSLIKESGAKYTVITSRHHDGFALWNTKFGNNNSVNNSEAGKDLLKPFVEELGKSGLKLGIYYSLSDWSHEYYTHFTKEKKRYEKDEKRWGKYLEYMNGQLEELVKKFNPDLIWFDGDWEHSAEEWQSAKIRQSLIEKNPNIILNSRLQGYGDYATPEQGVPVFKPKSKSWELCLTINDSWGYQPTDTNYKSPLQIIRIFADVIGMGGNLLLDIGPKADGSIPDEQIEVLKELGKWVKKHESAIYSTNAGISYEYFQGSSTLSKDSSILYLFVNGNSNKQIVLKGIKNKIDRVWVVGNGSKLNHKLVGKAYWSEHPGINYIDLPESVLDKYLTVIAVLLDGPIDLLKQ